MRAVIVLCAFCFFLQFIALAQVKEVRRVLVFYELGLSSPAVALADQQILAALQTSPYQIELYREYLETTLFPDPATQQELREWYIHKYREHRPDLIITFGPSPLKFVVDSHEKVFRDVRVIFANSSEDAPDHPKVGPEFTGVWEQIQPAKTLEAALRLQPDTTHVVVIGGVAPFDQYVLALVRDALRSYESKLDITYLTDLTMPQLMARLQHLPEHTVILLTNIAQDAAGTKFIGATQSAPMVIRAANAPVFSLSDVDFGHGEVGGDFTSYAKEGQIAGAMALRVLQGDKPKDIPIVRGANVYMFDWRALRRWGFKQNNLPPGSVVLYRQPSAWESYKGYIIGGISLILVETLLIFELAWQRRKRSKVEIELATTYDRLRLAVQAGRSAGWDWDLRSGQNRWFGDLQTTFGIPSITDFEDIEDVHAQIHSEDREFVLKTIADARTQRKPCVAEFRIVREDGSVRWITARGEFYYSSNGNPERMLGMAVDITERKTAEEALVRMSGRLIEAQEEERRRIAREIHDDYQQRLAILAIDLEGLAENIGRTPHETSKRLHELWNCVSELGADLHDLSHRLHSSTLESLGLVAGVRTFCEEFADQQGIQVDFAYEDVPRAIPADVALCLFRIAQEGLRNVKKHSGANRAEVRLEGLAEKLHLSVSDRGTGFDLNALLTRDGIGLRSMEERLRPLGGQLEIHSRRMEGTTINAWLPFKVAS
jgi:signal transduction histidine kinase